MKEDCRNDCVEALRFPRRLNNRPGLSRINYRIGTYSDIREALLRNLDKKANLSAWTHRGADDPGIALLEGASILGDILTFYQELYANEAYLRTAQWRESIGDLVRLLGYRLSPGLGGRATFAFEVKGDKPVTIPPGFPLKAEVEGSAGPVDFETASAAIAYPWLSKFSLYQPLVTPQVTPSTTEFYIESPDQLTAQLPVALKAGDRLMLGEVDSTTSPARLNNAEVIVVDSVRELHGVKIFKIKGRLKRTGPPPLPGVAQLAAYKLGRSFHHFGHNGPRTLVQPPASVTSTVTENADGSTTVESDSPLEYDISFFRDISGDTRSDTIVADYARPKPSQARSSSSGLSYLQGYYGYGNQSQGSMVLGTNAQVGLQAGLYNYGGFSALSPKPVVITDPTLAKTEFPLDAEVQDVATGVTLIIQGTLYRSSDGGTSGEYVMVRDVKAIRTTSVTWGLSTGTVSLLTLSQALDTSADSGFRYMNISEVRFHEAVSPLLTLRAAFAPDSPSSLDTLNFYGTSAQAKALAGRDLIFVKAQGEPVRARVKTVEAGTDDAHPRLHRITIDRADLNYAEFPNEPPYPVTIYGNIVEATQGKTEALAPLGNGDSRLAFQTFKIPKSPLTYLHSESATPPEVPELQIYVNNRLWRRVPSLFGRGADEEAYIVREDAEGDSWVQFGDGQTGARLPSGIKNVVAAYRTGTGAFGALKEKATVQAGARLDRLDKIELPVPVSGGAQPEDGENAREAAPGKIQSLDRLVSLEDFEREALSMAGVTKAAASWQLVEGIPQVVLTVLMEEGRGETAEELTATFAEANSGRGPNRSPITAHTGNLRYVAVKATFGYDSTYLEDEVKKAIQKALGISSGKPSDERTGLFSLRRRDFGQKEYATTVAGVIQQVEGVVWATVDGFDAPGSLAPGATIDASVPVNNLAVVECDSQSVLTLRAGHLYLVGVKVASAGGQT